MSVSIQIHLGSPSLDIFGEPDPSSAYSLSGHVSITLTSAWSLFERRRAVRVLLKSLSITFEGQSELILPDLGYAPARLCSVIRELAPTEAVELSNEGHEDDAEPASWNVVFNIPVPGWLPATAVFGDAEDGAAGTSYNLFATASLVDLDTGARMWPLCAFGGSKLRTVKAPRERVVVNRFINPPSVPATESSLFPMVTFAVQGKPEANARTRDVINIPLEILTKINVLASVPETIDVEGNTIPFSLRMRTEGLEAEDCQRLRISNFTVDIQQCEKYRVSVSSEYKARFPLPPKKHQPSHQPLLAPHGISGLFDLGLFQAIPNPDSVVRRSFSNLPGHDSGVFVIAGDTRVFAQDAEPAEKPTWYTVQSQIPFTQFTQRSGWEAGIRSTGHNGPFMAIKHDMHVGLTCNYDVPGSDEVLTERLHFILPLRFAYITPSTPAPPCPSHSPASSVSSMTGLLPEMPTTPYAQPLPAYSQLFDSNGDRKIDYSVPLPLYSPPGSPMFDEITLDEPRYSEDEESS